MWLLDLVIGATCMIVSYGCIVQRKHIAAVGYGVAGTLFLFAVVLRLTGGFA